MTTRRPVPISRALRRLTMSLGVLAVVAVGMGADGLDPPETEPESTEPSGLPTFSLPPGNDPPQQGAGDAGSPGSGDPVVRIIELGCRADDVELGGFVRLTVTNPSADEVRYEIGIDGVEFLYTTEPGATDTITHGGVGGLAAGTHTLTASHYPDDEVFAEVSLTIERCPPWEPVPVSVEIVELRCRDDNVPASGEVTFTVTEPAVEISKPTFIAAIDGFEVSRFDFDDAPATQTFTATDLSAGSHTLVVSATARTGTLLAAADPTFTIEPCTTPSGGGPSGDDPGSASSSPVDGEGPDDVAVGAADNVPVFLFAAPETPVGESTMVRTDDALLATIWIGGRPAGEVLTLWWVVFNRPEDCTPPGCDDDDLFLDGDRDAATNDGQIAAAGVVASYAGGTIVTEDGSAFVVARLEAGHPGIDVILGDDSDGVLSNVPGAEVHLVARSHGPAVAGLGVVQATSHAGGCETLLNPPALPAAPGECADIAFAIHRP